MRAEPVLKSFAVDEQRVIVDGFIGLGLAPALFGVLKID